jgi:uncharacterized protein YbaA (DUF1428 family)
MSRYVDGFVIPIKKKNLVAYKKMAKIGCKVWIQHGALDYYECVGEDLKNLWGIPFTSLCKLKADETVVFSFIVYKSKADRNRVNKKVHQDTRMNSKDFGMPFDMKRFTTGGFKVLVQK